MAYKDTVAQPHVGGCVADEPETWTTRCEGMYRAVEPWPVLLSAWLLAGKDAAEACVRPKQERLKARRSITRGARVGT